MGEGTQRVYVGEEVVDQVVHDGQRAYGLGGGLGTGRAGELCEGVCGIGGRGGERLCWVDVPSPVQALLLLDGFGMAVGRPTAAARSLEGARDVEGGAGPARRARLVAFDLADAARVAGLAQAVRLGGGPVLAVGEGGRELHALRAQGCPRALGGGRPQRALVGAQGMVRLLLQHIAEALDLGVQVLRVGLQRPRRLRLRLLLLLLLLASVGQRARGRRLLGRVDGRVVGFLGILRRHDARVYGRSARSDDFPREVRRRDRRTGQAVGKMRTAARRASNRPKLTVVTHSVDPLEESSDYKLRPMRLQSTKLPHP